MLKSNIHPAYAVLSMRASWLGYSSSFALNIPSRIPSFPLEADRSWFEFEFGSVSLPVELGQVI